MEFKVTETDKGFIIEDKNGDTAEISFSSIFKKGGRNDDGSLPKVETKDASLSIVEIGGEKYVRVQASGEDFIIALHDLEGAYTFDSAADKLKELGLTTFNKKQGFVICMYIEEINAMLEKAGGDPFKKDWYISSELYKPVGVADYISNICWCFIGSRGVLYSNIRFNGYFRCRPFLA